VQHLNRLQQLARPPVLSLSSDWPVDEDGVAQWHDDSSVCGPCEAHVRALAGQGRCASLVSHMNISYMNNSHMNRQWVHGAYLLRLAARRLSHPTARVVLAQGPPPAAVVAAHHR